MGLGGACAVTVLIPYACLLAAILPIAVGACTGFRFCLWHYLAYTAIVALELAYCLRWQEQGSENGGMDEKPLLRTIWSLVICMGLGNLFLPSILWRLALMSPFGVIQALVLANVVGAGVTLLLGCGGSQNAVVRAHSVITTALLLSLGAFTWWLGGQLAAYV